MIAKCFHCMAAIVALVSSAWITNDARAQCCGGAATAYYQPAAYTAHSPVVYQTYRTGWYPGYYLDRVRARLWGAPATYVAAYPSTYVASYPSTYYASYPTYTAGYATSYAPVSTCSSCSTYSASYSPCSTCATVQQVTLRPACTTCGDPCTSCDSCSGCSTCGSYGVSQASYEQPAGCACGVSSSTVITTEPPQGTPSNGGTQPGLPGDYPSGPRQTDKPIGSGETEPEPDPANPNGGAAEDTQQEATTGSGALLEAPQLFSPNDRTAMRSIPPVRMAVYEQPIGQQRVSAKPIKVTRQQAERDAVGWRSASN